VRAGRLKRRVRVNRRRRFFMVGCGKGGFWNGG
jgi:hypothetical protein